MSQASQAIFQQISTLLTQHRTAEARAELERLLALDPEDPEARSQAGDVCAYTGAHSAAYKHYNQAAETYNRMGRADMALAVHHKILELDPGTLDAATQTRLRLLALLVSAEDAIVAGQYDKAVADYHAAIRQFPNHTISYQRLASLLVRLNRVDEAADQYLLVARAFYAHGVKAKARPYFERVLELKPAQSESLESLLACLRAENNQAEGGRFIRAAVQSHLQAGAVEQADALFKRLAPGGEAADPLEAAVLLQTGAVERAERVAGRLDLRGAEAQDLFKGLARAARERGDRASVEVYLRWVQGPALGVPPVSPVASQDVPARTVASGAAPAPGAVSQQDRAVLRTMGEVCLAEGMFDEAQQIFERLVKGRAEDASSWDLLNRARAGLGLEPKLPGASAPTAAKAPAPLPTPANAPVPTPPPVLAPLPTPAKAPVPTPTSPVPTPLPTPAKAPTAPLPSPTPLAPLPVPAQPKVQPPAPVSAATLPKSLPAPPPLAPPVLPKPASTGAWALPSRILPRPAAAPVEAQVSSPIVRTAYVLRLGELPPAGSDTVDRSDELIE